MRTAFARMGRPDHLPRTIRGLISRRVHKAFVGTCTITEMGRKSLGINCPGGQERTSDDTEKHSQLLIRLETGKVEASTHVSGFGVNQDLSFLARTERL